MAVERNAAIRFYEEALGLALKFGDGDRFGALDVAGVSSGPCASLKVDDVDAVVARLSAAGAKVERPAEDGPHERRAVLRDPAGNPLVIYGPLAG